MFHCSRRCGRTKKRFSGLLTAHTLDTTQRIILQAMMNRSVDDKSQHNPFAYHETRKTKSTKTDENLDSFDARMTEKAEAIIQLDNFLLERQRSNLLNCAVCLTMHINFNSKLFSPVPPRSPSGSFRWWNVTKIRNRVALNTK